jgi:hypothetical protein
MFLLHIYSMYIIYKASVSPGFVQQTTSHRVELMLEWQNEINVIATYKFSSYRAWNPLRLQ